MEKRLNGKFIVLEGLDGVGKTTVATELVERLSPRYGVVLTREPFHKKWKEIKDLCAFTSNEALAHLMQAFRLEHIKTVIRPALEAGKVVICDRFIYSTLAYQGCPSLDPHHYVRDLVNLTSPLDVNPQASIVLDSGNYSFLKERVLRRDPTDSFPDYKSFEEIRQTYLDYFTSNRESGCHIVSVTEKNGAKRSLESIISDMEPIFNSIGIHIPK